MAWSWPRGIARSVVGELKSRFDGWANVLSGLGYEGRDRRLGAFITTAPTLNESALSELYSGDALARRICELPANEQTRQWVSFSSDGDADAGKQVLQHLQTIGAQSAVREAKVWARLYGGSIILLGANDGRRAYEPLNEDGIRSLDWLTVLDRHAVEIAGHYDTPGKNLGRPERYRILPAALDNTSNSIPEDDRVIHESRVLRFDGPLTTRLRRGNNDGWNDSIFVALYEHIRDVAASYGGMAHLLTDFSQATFKIKGLADLFASKQHDVVVKRLQTMDLVRSVVRAVVIDEDEEFERKATPVAGLPDLVDRLVLVLSAVTGIPVTLLMGQAPAGLQATGASDIRYFYDNMHAQQEAELRPQLEKLLRLVLRTKSGPTRGKEPENWSFAFNPLWQLTEAEIAEARNKQAQTDQIYITNTVLDPMEVRSSRFGGDAYSNETTLDPEIEPGADDEPTDPDVDPDPQPEPNPDDDPSVEE
jgi:phage-related protein (TIGR01555 family)